MSEHGLGRTDQSDRSLVIPLLMILLSSRSGQKGRSESVDREPCSHTVICLVRDWGAGEGKN